MTDGCCAGPTATGAGGSDAAHDSASGFIERWRTYAALVAAVMWAGGVLADAAGHGGTGRVLFAVGAAAGAATFAPGAVRSLRHGRLGVALLMSIAAVGATVLGKIAEAAALAFLFSISEALEEWAVAKSRRGLRAVLLLVPETTRVRRAGIDVEIPTADVVVGDVIVIRAGERIATDGVVRTGTSVLDVSAVTGESIPIEVGTADQVLAGTVNGGGLLEIETTAASTDSTLARIVRAVEQAQDRKGRSQRLADRIARPLVPGILVVATVVASVGFLLGDPHLWIQRALVVLVAASPCAFAIGVPVTVFAAIGAATNAGLVIKGGAALEALAGIKTIALDKTGTLTRNRPTVTDVHPTADHTPQKALALAAALEAHSDHPLAAAINAVGQPTDTAIDVQTIAGFGITGTVGDEHVRIGKPGFVDPGPLADDVTRLEAQGATVIVVEADGNVVAAISIRDEIRPEAQAVVTALHGLHLDVVMLTGDNAGTANAIGAAAGISDVRAGLLPTGKADAIRQLRTRGPVAMVGDGINDAPALATADVGIAMGAAGTDVAIEAADIAIMGDHLTHLPDLISHARRTHTIMIQNLTLSGLIIATLIPIAATGLLRLGAVVAIHELAEIIVIANALRARRHLTNHAHLQTATAPATPTKVNFAALDEQARR